MDNTLEKLIEACSRWVIERYEATTDGAKWGPDIELYNAINSYQRAQEAVESQPVSFADLFQLLQVQHAEKMDVLDQINKRIRIANVHRMPVGSGPVPEGTPGSTKGSAKVVCDICFQNPCVGTKEGWSH